MFGLITGILTVATLALAVVDIGVSVCKNLGIIKPDVKSQELGDKVIQAREQGICVENYEGQYQKYIDDINSFDIDPIKSESYSPEEKLNAAGQLVVCALIEHYGKDSGVDKFLKYELTEDNMNFYQSERVKAYLEEFHADQTDMGKIGDYFDNKLESLAETKIIDAKLVEAEKTLGVDEEKAEEKIDKEIERREEK